MAGTLVLAGAAQARAACAFPSAPRVLAEEGEPQVKESRLLQVWEFADAPVWWSTAEPAGYGDFRARTKRLAGETDPVKLLGQAPSTNNRLVAQNAAAWIAPATCLEKLLFQIQDRRSDTFTAPTEFFALVLRSADGARLRVYFYTVNQDGIGRASPISEPAAADNRAGWTVLGALHNHNFHPGDARQNSSLAPSLPDAQFNANMAKETGLQSAWITNGLHTAHIPASAFGAMEQDD
ncbi:MAG: hypothetical protein ACREEG_05435 [Phenylobacterium sp.]